MTQHQDQPDSREDFYEDDDDCPDCGGDGGYASCMEDCCPVIGGEECCDDPVCWRVCSTCRGGGFAKATTPPDHGVEGLDLDELEKVARDAGLIAWDFGFAHWGQADVTRVDPTGESKMSINGIPRNRIADYTEPKYAAHIAAFDPPTVLKLIALARLNPPAASGGGDKEGFISSQGTDKPPLDSETAGLLRYAQRLATVAANKVGCSPEWFPLDDIEGCLSQIDNCLTVLVRDPGSPLVRGGE